MIHAADMIALAAAERQRGETVDAAILERRDSAVAGAEQNDRIIEEGGSERLAWFEVHLEPCDIPGISDISHLISPAMPDFP
jgi:hypothetical protein